MRLMLDTCVIIDLLTDIESMSMMSSDTKFPFYRNQGLELIEY